MFTFAFSAFVKLHFQDPNAPKRPQTAFFIFSAEHREQVKKELPEGSRVGDIAKRLGVMWGELDADKKKEYQDQADDAKAEYEKAMEEYNSSVQKVTSHNNPFLDTVSTFKEAAGIGDCMDFNSMKGRF